jgi:hypothetical protein
LLKTIQSKSETEAAIALFGKVRSAILEGGYDDLASAAVELTGLIKEQSQHLKDRQISPLAKPLCAIADILAVDSNYLHAAIAAYGDAAHFSAGKDEELNTLSIIGILEKAEFLSTPEDRIKAYHLAWQEAPALSEIAARAKLKSREQKNSAYFKMRAPTELAKLDEAVVEGDLKAVLGDGIRQVIRQQAPSGDILYSVVVPRRFSRDKLTQAGVQNTLELLRTRAGDDLDRIAIPANMLPQQTQRDINFLTRLQGAGIYIDAIHDRTRDSTGAVTGYRFAEGANSDRLRYMGIDTHEIIPQDGKIIVPVEIVKFYADPALIGKWSWIPTGSGIIRSRVPHNERSTIIQSLQAYGITPCGNKALSEKNGYIEVSGDAKVRLNKVIHQHILQQRNDHLLKFAETLPNFASSIAVAAYKDACGTVSGLRHRRK